MKWFKLHTEFAHDPKLRSFSAAQRYYVIVLFCLAADSDEPGTIMLDAEDIAATMGIDEEEYEELVTRLEKKGIVTRMSREGHESLSVTHWDKRQYTYPSDRPEASAERKRRQRERERNQADTRDIPSQNTDVTSMSRVQQNRTDSEQNRAEQNRAEQNREDIQASSPPVVASPDAPQERPPTPKRFVPPTVQAVRDYMALIGIAHKAEAWYAHYESNGWMVGKVRMRDWKAACRTWLSDTYGSRASPPPVPPPPRSREELEAEERAAITRILDKRRGETYAGH